MIEQMAFKYADNDHILIQCSTDYRMYFNNIFYTLPINKLENINLPRYSSYFMHTLLSLFINLICLEAFMYSNRSSLIKKCE